MVVYSDLENKEKELKQALELADSLDERKALRLELREVRKLLFETPKTNDVSKPIETKKQVTTTDINNNNTMTLNSQDSFDAPSVSKTAAERAARRARRAQHMKSLVNDSSSLIMAADTVSSQQTKTEQKVEPEVIQPKIEVKQQLSVGVTDHSSANSQAPKMPKFNANSSPGLRRTATWSPKDRVASKNVTTNAFSANKAKFGSQAGGESPFSFGISYVKQKDADNENKKEEPIRRTFSVNKYTPTERPVSFSNNNNDFQVNRSNTFSPSSSFSKPLLHGANESKLISGSLEEKKQNPVEINFNINGHAQANNDFQQKSNASPHFHNASEIKYNSGFTSTSNTTSNGNKWSPPQNNITKTHSVPSFNKYNTPIARPYNDRAEEKPKNENVDDLGLNFMRSKDIFSKMQENKNEQLQNNRPSSAFGYGQRNVSKTLSLQPEKTPAVNKFALRNSLSLSASLKTDINTSQESSNKDASANRLSLQDRTPNRFQSTRDASPGRFEPNRDKSPGRFDINRDKSPNRFDINRNKIGSVRDKSPSPFDRTQQDRPKSHIGVAGMKGISGSASNRMSMFKEAEEKQAREIEMKKKRDEERKKNAEVIAAKAAEDAKRRAEEDERRKVEAEKKKAEEEERRKKEEEEKAKNKENEPAAEEVKDSEKMKYAAPCMRKREKKKVVRRTMSISSIVLDWVQEMIKDYPVEVTNFSSSWNNGMAFCALIHHFNPDEFDYYELNPENKRHNFDLAFNTGLKCKNIPILLDTEDMVRMKKPEPRSVQCYIQWIWSVYGPTSGYGPTPKEVQTASLN